MSFMDIQSKDSVLYALLIAMGMAAIGISATGRHYVSLLITGIIGLTIAVHLHREKMESMEEVVCPIGESCFDVITSKYSDFLGISVEIYGMLYYGLILTGYTVALLFTVPEWFSFFLLGNTAIALLFSIYLTWIQAVPLGKWCIWCVTSASACVAIFSFALLGLNTPVDQLLTQFIAIPHAVYAFSIALGMGVALSGDALFLNFLKDFEMSETQAKAINTLYDLMWAALAFTVLGGVGYFYASPEVFYNSVNLVTALALGVIIVNGALLYLFVSHKLTDIRFREDEDEEVSEEIQSTRRMAFMLTGISGASWITVFFLTFAQIPQTGLKTLLTVYLALLVMGMAAGLIAEFVLKKSALGEFKSNIPILFD